MHEFLAPIYIILSSLKIALLWIGARSIRKHEENAQADRFQLLGPPLSAIAPAFQPVPRPRKHSLQESYYSKSSSRLEL